MLTIIFFDFELHGFLTIFILWESKFKVCGINFHCSG